MPDLFGMPAGIEAADQGQRARELHNLSMAKGDLELQQAQIELARQNRMLQLMGQRPQGGGQSVNAGISDLADDMDYLAKIAMDSGMPDKAREYATAGSNIRKNQVDLTEKRLDGDIKEMNLMGSLLADVKDATSWRRANAMFQMQTGRPSPWAQVPYNDQIVDRLRTGVQTAKDRALTKAALARESASEAEVKEREARVPLIRAQKELTEQRTANLRKAGATGQIPKSGDIQAITDLMFKDFGGSQTPEDARVLARPVAEEALRLQKEQNLSKSEASMRAYQKAKARGDFGGLKPRRPDKGSANAPLEMPDQPSKLKANMYYQKGGQKYLFTGTAFVPVGSGPGQIEPEAEEEEGLNEDDYAPATEQ